MEINLIRINDFEIAEVTSDSIIIETTQDALDLMANCSYQGADRIIIYKKNILPDFFDLKTGIAGEILQKVSNYRMRLAIVGDFSNYTSKSLRDFIFESNKAGRVIFLEDRETAIKKLG